MNLSPNIDFSQLKSLIAQRPTEEKVQIVRMLEEETFPLQAMMTCWL